jgi:hypothetical protein
MNYRKLPVFLVFLLTVSLPGVASAQNLASTAAQNPPSVAREINKELPEWMEFGGEYRYRFEGVTGVGGVEENDDVYGLSRLRLDLGFKLGDHWKVFVQAQDSQAGGFDANPDPAIHENDFDLRQAYVEYRQSDKGGWGVKVGRQELNYGDQRLVGALNWTNTARTFDAAKLTYSNADVAVDVFASSVVAIQDNVFDKHLDGQNFYGTHATFKRAVPRAELNGYVFWKTTPFVLAESGAGDADTVTVGGRLAGKLAKRTDYGVEIARQLGSFGADEIRATATHGRIIHGFSDDARVPKLRVEYNYASGDASPADGVRGTFDQLYPTGHAKYGVIDQVGWRNIHNARIGAILKPHAKLTLEVDYHSFWLAHRRDGLYNAGGALVARVPGGAAGSHVAQEADVQLTWSIFENVSFGAGYGHWFPGSFWKQATPGASRDFVYTMAAYRF